MPGAAEFAGQVAVVTGGAGGIGAAVARLLAASGADVAIVDIAEASTGELAALAPDPAQKFAAWRCDATSTAAVRAVCDEISAAFGPPSILINNVGGSGVVPVSDIEETSDEIWDAILSLNLGSMLRFTRCLVPGMKARRYGRIVNFSSSLRNGVFGGAGTVGARLPYVTAKNGIVGFTRQLAKDLAPFGIVVNAVAPGFTLPDEDARITRRFRALPPERQRELTANVPMGRPADGADIANAVCFLASPRNAYMAGEVLTVAGGE